MLDLVNPCDSPCDELPDEYANRDCHDSRSQSGPGIAWEEEKRQDVGDDGERCHGYRGKPRMCHSYPHKNGYEKIRIFVEIITAIYVRQSDESKRKRHEPEARSLRPPLPWRYRCQNARSECSNRDRSHSGPVNARRGKSDGDETQHARDREVAGGKKPV